MAVIFRIWGVVMRRLIPDARRYVVAILAALVALVVREMLSPFFRDHNPYHTVWLAVVFSAWYCGVGPSIVGTLLSVVGVWYFFLPPFHSFALKNPEVEISGIIGFMVFSSFIIALGEANRRSKARSEREVAERKQIEDELRRTQAQLESRVQERTAELNSAYQSLRQLSAQLLQSQDEERRRLARELHDSVGQLLASIKMNSAVFQSVQRDSPVAKAATDNAILIDQVISEIRTMSHLLHPPLLDEIGLPSALRWYVDGFSERSKIAVDVDIADDIERLGNDMEIAIFRVVQECLTNVHRHSGSRSAALRLAREDGHVQLEIKDAGKGIPLGKQLALSSKGQLGVGFRGMRERVHQLGGNLDVRSDSMGTTITATLPIGKTAALSAQEVA
ncbi:MAG: sensor histidine kinase [Terriglobales bacterium]